MSSEFGDKIRVSVFGESHGEAIGCVVNGLPAGESVDLQRLGEFMARRKPGSRLATKRKESDTPHIVSGLYKGKTTGSPLTVIIKNEDAHSSDYSELRDTPRPAHADYPAFVKYGGFSDMRGGGHFSGRLTAPLCAAGGIALQILERKGILVGAHLYSVGKVKDVSFDECKPTKELFASLAAGEVPVVGSESGELMKELIERCEKKGDSVGGVVECSVLGLPAGLGDPMFDTVEGKLAFALFGVPGVKGVEFGSGFQGAESYGSQNNDPYFYEEGQVVTRGNCHGGVLGGITTGMPLVFRAAFKPTPSIALPQSTVRLSDSTEAQIAVGGRHDPCIALRAVAPVEAVTALVVLGLL